METFIDPAGTYGFGFYNFRKRGKLSVRETIREEVNALKGEALQKYVTSKVRQHVGDGFEVNDKKLTEAMQQNRFTKQDRDEIHMALMRLEEERVKSLALKNALRMHAHMGDAPIVKQADGSIGYAKAKTDEELIVDWYKASAQLDQAKQNATVDYDRLDPEAQEAYRKAHGDPHSVRGTSAIETKEDLGKTFDDEWDAQDIQRAIDLPTKRTMAGQEVTEAQVAAKAEAEQSAPFLENSQGGAVGLLTIRPKDHVINQLGVPALREVAFNMKQEQNKGSTGLLMSRMDEGESLVPREYRNHVSGADEDALPTVSGKIDTEGNIPADIRDQALARTFSDFRTQNRLPQDMSDGETYQVMKLLESIEELRREQGIYIREAKAAKVDPAVQRRRLNEMYQKFFKVVTRTDDDIKQMLREAWDTNKMDMGMKLYRYDPESGTAKSLSDSALASYRGDVEKAMVRTNAYGSLKDSDVTLEASTVEATPMAGRGYTENTAQSLDSNVGGAYYPTATKWDVDKETGQRRFIELEDMMDNPKASVHVIHNVDVSAARGTVGFMANHPLLAGLIGKTITPEQLAKIKAAMSESDAEKIFGGQAGIMFFDKSTGLQIVDPKIVGRNYRRKLTMFEAEYILQNSKNQYVGEKLEVSALFGGATIKQRSSLGDLMMDSNRELRNVLMSHANEQAEVLRYLRGKDDANAAKNGVAFDNARPYNAIAVSERPDLLTAAFRVAAHKEINSAAKHLDRIDPVLREAFQLKTKDADTGNLKTTEFDDGLLDKAFIDSIDVPAGLKPLLEAAYGAHLMGTNKVADSEWSSFSHGHHFFDAWRTAQGRQIVAKYSQNGEFQSIVFTLTRSMDPKAVEAAAAKLNKIISKETGLPPNAHEFTLTMENGVGVLVPKKMSDFFEGKGKPPIWAEDLTIGVDMIREKIRRTKNMSADIQAGYMGDGYASTMLKMATDPNFGFGKAILDGVEKLNDDQAAKVWTYIQNHDIGVSKISEWTGAAYQRRIVDNAVNLARKAYSEGDGTSTQGMQNNLYRGDWVDPVTKEPVEPQYFMNGDKFSLISDSHAKLNNQFEGLIEAGVLTVPQVRMLRAALAGMKGEAFNDLRFQAIDRGSDIINPKDVTPVRTALSGPARSKVSANAELAGKKAIYHTDGKVDTIYLLKNRLGNDMDVVDVILHEVGHAAFSRYIPEGHPLRSQMEVDFNTRNAKEALKQAIILMHGGQTNRAQAMIDSILPKDGKVDIEEFAAQWFSYDMSSRTLADRKTLSAAYSALESAQPGLAGTIKSMVQAMINFAQRRFKGFSSLLRRTDPSTIERLDSYMDILRGRSNLQPHTQWTPRAMFYGGRGRGRAVGKVDLDRAWQNYRQTLEDWGGDELHPAVKDAKAEVDAIQTLLEATPTARAADEDPKLKEQLDKEFDEVQGQRGDDPASAKTPEEDGPPPRTPEEQAKIDKLVQGHGWTRVTEIKAGQNRRGPAGGDGRAGRRHFGDFLEESPNSAQAWFATHVVPMLANNRADDFDFGKENWALDYSFTGAEHTSFAAFAYSAMMPNAKTAHHVHSEVMMTVGDAKYPIMQLLSNLLDTHSSGDIHSTFKGRPAKTLAHVARQLLSETADRMALLSDELFHAMAKDKKQWWKKANLYTSEADQLEVANISRTAVKLLEHPDSAIHKQGLEELASYGPEVTKVVNKMTETFEDISLRIKDDAVAAGMIDANRADASGLVPLLLKQEVMGEKATKFAPRLREEYGKAMLAKAEEVQDLDGMIAAGHHKLAGLVRKHGEKREAYVDRIKQMVKDGILKKEILTDRSPRGDQKLISHLANHFNRADATEFNVAKYIAQPEIRADILQRYKNSITSDEGLQNPGRTYLSDRRNFILKKSAGRKSRVKVSARDLSKGLSDHRQFILGRKLGSSAHYHMGDGFLSRSDLLGRMGDMFELNPDQLAASLARGIGLDAADSANLSKMFPDLYGMTTRDLLNMVEDLSSINTNSPTARSMQDGLDHLFASREQLGGGRPNMEKTGNAMVDFMNRYASDASMMFYGGNMGPAMLAETTSIMVLQGMPKLLKNPVKFASMATQALTEGLSPIRKTKMIKYLNYAAHVARGQGSIRNVDRTTDAALGVDGRQLSALSRLGGYAYSFSGGPQVQGFNKAFSMLAAQDDLLGKMSAAHRLSNMLTGMGYTPNKAEFKRIARDAGFGGNWELAARMVRSGIIDNIGNVQKLARETSATKKGQFDLDDLWEATSRLERGSTERAELDEARRAIWNFLDDSVATFMVEPRVLDMNLTENKGWAKFQDIFMSWTRAFAAQKGGGFGNKRTRGGRAVGLQHVITYAMAQVVWDSIYTSIQEVGRGEDPNKILHEVQTDPVGWFMQKATRLPFYGAYASQLNAVIVQALRNQSAKLGIPGLGYMGKDEASGLDFTSSPASGAVLKGLNILLTPPRVLGKAMSGEYTKRDAMDDAQIVTGAMPFWGNTFMKGLTGYALQDKGKSVAQYDAEYKKKLNK